ncbi:MAG: hypothetical protein Q8P05_01675 [Candidatus Diapherotrites archaeon]|nr:hypothetical protein [Candidatus Diapherotrites archaeon]MDZ4256365.1 hypothetical protein [archaeon]
MTDKQSSDEVEDTEDIYDEDQIAEEMEEDELKPAEAGFMEGYMNPDQTEREIEATRKSKKTMRRPTSAGEKDFGRKEKKK